MTDNPLGNLPEFRMARSGDVPGAVPVSFNPLPSIARLTVVETSYHQPREGPPKSVGTPWSRNLKTDEQVFERRMTVGAEWVQLETGWLPRGSMLVLENETPEQKVIPTPEQQQAVDNCILEVAFATLNAGPYEAFSLIYPGESSRYTPADARRLYLRCRQGSTRCLVTFFPE